MRYLNLERTMKAPDKNSAKQMKTQKRNMLEASKLLKMKEHQTSTVLALCLNRNSTQQILLIPLT
ncbi:hypothetical protein D3C76_1478480 [compost metagenome]